MCPKCQGQPVSRPKGPRYTPVSKRQDKPDAIAWLLRHHPELSDAQVNSIVTFLKSLTGELPAHAKPES